MVKIGVQIHPQTSSMADLRAAWTAVDALGVDSLWTWDHFFPPLYGAADDPHFEGWQVLAAMAATTTKVTQIGMLVSGNGYRNPDLLADMARTLDHLSDGRAVLGIGSGWMDRDEHEYGYPVRTPIQRLDELAAALPRIRRRIDLLNPPPIGRMPILIGGNGERRTLRLVARYADMWNGYGDADTIRHKNRVIDDWCRVEGREPRDIERTVWVQAPSARTIGALVDAGAEHIILGLPAPYDLSAVERLVQIRSELAGRHRRQDSGQ